MSLTLRQLVKFSKVGDLRTALDMIGSLSLSSHQASQVFISICHACVNETVNENFTIEELCEIITATVNRITDFDKLDEQTITNYVTSSYHILKYLVAQDGFNAIIELREVWRPSFITTRASPNCVNVYRMQCMLVGKYLMNVSQSSHLFQRVEQLTYLLMEMSDQLLQNAFVNNGPYVFLKHILSKIDDELLLSSLSKYLFENCLTQTDYEHWLLDLFFTMFVSAKYPMSLLSEIISNYDDDLENMYNTVFQALKVIVKDGISLECLNLICDSISIMEGHRDQLVHAQILQQIFVDYYYKNCYLCQQELSWKFQDLLCEILFPLSSTLGTGNKQCQNCNCQLLCDIPSQLSMLMVMLGSFKRCVTSAEEIPCNVFESVVDLCNNIASLIYNLREKECKYWQHYCVEFLVTLYNTGIYIDRKKKYVKYAIIIFELVVQEYLFAEGHVAHNKLIDRSCIHTSLNLIADNYLNLGETKKAMAAIALNVFRCDGELKCRCISQWIQVKTRHKKDLTIKKNTMASLLTNQELKRYNITLSKEQISCILLKEVKMYCAIWRSKIPLAECCEQIYNLNNPVLTIEALCLAWFDIPESITMEMLPIVSNTLQQVTNLATSIREKIDIAKVYFLMYHIQIKTLENEINKQVSIEPKEMPDYENIKYGLEVADNKWDCAIYGQLKVENLHEIKEPLIRARQIIEKIFSSLDTEKKNLLCELNLFEYIMELAFTFSLHGDRIEYLKTLSLCKKLAEMINSVDWMLKTTGWMMQELDVNTILHMLKQTRDLLKHAESNTVIGFYINASMAYFNNGMVQRANSTYIKLKDILNSTTGTDKILSLELEYLEWNLLGVSCKSAIDNHYEDFIVKASYLCSKLESFFYDQDYTTSRVKVMLSQYLMHTHVHYYYWWKTPREGRAAAKSMVQLCQRYILPLRFAETFTYLCDMDLLCEKLDDCQAKINGLSTLLDMSTPSTEYNNNSDNNVDMLTTGLQEMALDTKIPKLTYSTNSASPVLPTDTLKYPQFLLHNRKCECFYCTSLDYQKLVIKHVVLKGNLWVLRNEPKTADFFYNFALNIYNRIMNNKEEYVQKVKNFLGVNTCDVKDVFAECYANLLFNQAKIFVGTKKYNKISEELLKAVERIKFMNVSLYNQAYTQRLDHLFSIQHIPPTLQLSPIPSNRSPNTIKTPEDNITKIIVASSVSPKPVKKGFVRAIKFDWSDDKEQRNKPSVSTEPPSGAIKKVLLQNVKSTTSGSTAPTNAFKVKVYTAKENVQEKKNSMQHLAVPKLKCGKSSKKTSARSASSVLTTTQDGEMTELNGVRRSARNKMNK